MTFGTNGNSFAATFTDYTLHNDASSGTNMIEVSGGIDSPCLGASVQLATTTALQVLGAVPCPHAGVVTVTSGDTTDGVIYTGTGGVKIDLGNDMSVDETFTNCFDPSLYQCAPS